MADALSKADFACFKRSGGDSLQLEPATIPKSVLRWCARPTIDDNLADKILAELSGSNEILGYNEAVVALIQASTERLQHTLNMSSSTVFVHLVSDLAKKCILQL